ncbi:MAG: 30S ribosomal protein S7 [Methanobacteriota archaeon]|nr:MAG: 30S ribosomal protein S7 [Euryarchaeota archaeon]
MKLFNKWDYEGITFNDRSVEQVVSLKEVIAPHSFGRHGDKKLAKIHVNIVERLLNKLMRGGTGRKVGGKVIRSHGRLQGKKLHLMKSLDKAFDIINERTKENPIQVLVRAVENSAPREDVTRVQLGSVRYQLSVDISATRRVDVALKNIALSALMKSFNSDKKLSETLADEIIAASNNDSQASFAVRRKDEIERMAKSAR